MEHTKPKTPFDSLVDEFERRSRAVRQIRDLVVTDRELARQLHSALGAWLGGPGEANGATSNFDRIASVLAESPEWMSVDELAEATRMTPNSIRQVLYKTRPDAFRHRQREGGGRTQEWRLQE